MSTIAILPFEATKWIGAAPWLSRAVKSARSESSNLHMSLLPLEAARCKGVRNQYCSKTQFMSAPALAKGLSKVDTFCCMHSFKTWFLESGEYSRNHSAASPDGMPRKRLHAAADLAQSAGQQNLNTSGRITSSWSSRLLHVFLYSCHKIHWEIKWTLTPAANMQTCTSLRHTSAASALARTRRARRSASETARAPMPSAPPAPRRPFGQMAAPLYTVLSTADNAGFPGDKASSAPTSLAKGRLAWPAALPPKPSAANASPTRPGLDMTRANIRDTSSREAQSAPAARTAPLL
mmetsp:Transcript_71123/g.206271  ORF Transcript_71123/g.206271 Transcript_71123/m.206271 type:complete len:293 (-) Transcript_71123:92-970(-)